MKFFTAVILAGVLIFPACDMTNVLDVDPPNDLVPENVVQNAEDAESLLNGAYASMHDQYYYMFSELTPGLLSGSMAYNGFLADAEMAANAITPENTNVRNYWKAFYKMMDAANVVLDLVDELPDSEFNGQRKQEILAEARYLRAMALFDALRYFGQFSDLESPLGVIARTEPVDYTTRNETRRPVTEVYDQILEDLDAVVLEAPELTEPYRASQTAGKALKAKVLLFMERYAEAADLADEVIADQTRELAADFDQVFSQGFNSQEMIFMRYTDEVTTADGERKQFTYGNNYAIAGGWLNDLLSDDPREASTYNEENGITKINNETFHRPTYFMRLAEVYLIKAEGLARTESASLEESKEALETVRSRALGETYSSAAETKAELLDEIFDEIARELAFENGSEWFAAIRFGKIMDLKPEITSEDQFLLPIPQSELESNSQFGDQNPGYN